MVGQFELAWCIELEWNKGGVNYAEEKMFGRKDPFSNGSAILYGGGSTNKRDRETILKERFP